MAHNVPKSGKRRGGAVSIVFISVALFIAAVATVAFALFELSRTTNNAQSLYELERERTLCDKAIQQFMDGSDYLTQQVQLYVVKGDRSYMDSYWTEVNSTKSRDEAVETIIASDITEDEREAAINGKAESDELITGEVWAMRMVAESLGMPEDEMPEEVAAGKLDPADAALSPAEKREAAIAYVFGPEYSMSKSVIRSNVNTFRTELGERFADKAMSSLDGTRSMSVYMSSTLVAFLVVFIIAVACFITQVVTPVVSFSKLLKGREENVSARLPESGAYEIRQFARAFNSLSQRVDENTKRLERLGYVDFLTGVPNRASITQCVSGMIERGEAPLGILMIDIDNFKKFNDTYGHALGDRVLKLVAEAVCAGREEGGIAGRLCGEEFVVAARNVDEAALDAIAEGVLRDVRAINAGRAGMSNAENIKITVSAGGAVWQGDAPTSFEKLLGMADKALYISKETGKNRYTFYK